MVLANAASSGGISPLSHVICGELLPLSVRPLFGNVLSLYLGGLAFSFIHLFPVLRSTLGSAGLFATLAGVNVLLIVHATCLLPETRGLSLEQVQIRHFSSKKKPIGGGGDEKEDEAKTGRTETERGEADAGADRASKTDPATAETGGVSGHK